MLTNTFQGVIIKMQMENENENRERKLMSKARTDYLYVDFPPFNEISKSAKRENKNRIFTGGVRINNSMFRTKKEDAEYREKSLKRKLP